jgi:glutamine synthetase type III
MLQQEKTELNAVNELISSLLELYEKDKALVTKETSSTKRIKLRSIVQTIELEAQSKKNRILLQDSQKD